MKKDIGYRMQELEKALDAIQKANAQYQQKHEDAWLLMMTGQLRGLVAIGKSKTMHPLLLELAEELNIPLKLYSRPGKVNPPPADLLGAIICGKTWSTRQHPGLIEFELRTWLETHRYHVDALKIYTTPNEVLRAIAEKSGGVHYDPDRAPSEESLSRASRGNDSLQETGVQMFLQDIAALVYWMGMRLGYTWNCRLKGIDSEQDQRIIAFDAHMEKIQV